MEPIKTLQFIVFIIVCIFLVILIINIVHQESYLNYSPWKMSLDTLITSNAQSWLDQKTLLDYKYVQNDKPMAPIGDRSIGRDK